MSTASGDAHEGAEAPTLLDTLARVPAAVELVLAKLGYEGRRALRLVHPQLRDAVGEATTKLRVNFKFMKFMWYLPTPRRWPRLEELTIVGLNQTWALERLGSETWGSLHKFTFNNSQANHAGEFVSGRLDPPSARALAAALRRMPALRAFELEEVLLPRISTATLFRASNAEDVPCLRSLTARSIQLAPRGARALAASGWRLEELDLRGNTRLGAAGTAALVAAPTFAIRRLVLAECGLNAASLLSLANASWSLEELDLSHNDFSGAGAGPALAALSRHRRLRRLSVGNCHLTPDGFGHLARADLPQSVHLGHRSKLRPARRRRLYRLPRARGAIAMGSETRRGGRAAAGEPALAAPPAAGPPMHAPRRRRRRGARAGRVAGAPAALPPDERPSGAPDPGGCAPLGACAGGARHVTEVVARGL